MVFGYHDQIANLPGSLATREALLKDALKYMDGLATELGPELAGQPQLARELAESYSRIAALQGDGFAPSAENLQASRANLGKALALVPYYLDNTASAERRDPAAWRVAAEMHEGPCHPGHARRPARRDQGRAGRRPPARRRGPAPRPAGQPHPGPARLRARAAGAAVGRQPAAGAAR